MRFPPNTQVWVKCDDGVWWPGTVRETDADMQAFLCDGEDCCVEFYHTPGDLYPLRSTDEVNMRPLHGAPDERSAEEGGWFSHADVRGAVAAALREYERTHPTLPTPATSSVHEDPSPNGRPFSASVLHNVQQLLDAVGGATAERLRGELQHARVSVAAKDVRRQEARERQTRKRRRPTTPLPSATPPSAPQRSRAGDAARRRTAEAGSSEDTATFEMLRPAVTSASPPPPWPASGTTSSASGGATSSTSAGGESETRDEAVPFVSAARRHVLEVLRHEVFENAAVFVLSPVYHFVDLLGAVVVENSSLTTTLPSPYALRQRPPDGFSPHRRVLLVPLTEDYEHTTGWMVPTEVEGVRLAMSLFVNDAPVSLPPNWQLTPAKEASAVKTAVTVDITDVVMPPERELFSLQVVFTGDAADLEMWRGVIACVFVEEVGLARLGERIVSTYHKPRTAAARRSPSSTNGEPGLIAMTEASVKIQCPITTLTMEIPVRSMYCEHLQCVELAAVLIHCTRQNVWNCPLCSAAMKPDDIVVNYRLKDWIASHSPQTVAAVEYVVETQSGRPLKVVYKPKRAAQPSTVEVVDDEDDDD